MSLGVYIQVPFCQTKCTYCNFHTGVVSPKVYEPYVAAVCREVQEVWKLGSKDVRKDGLPGIPLGTVDTVYVGGGTPSLLEPQALHKLLDAVRGAFHCALEEVTLEADPETITPEKAEAWLKAGFNRISLGSQSFSDAELKAAGRMHRREDIYSANRILRGAGFANLSFDLICGLPHQTAQSWAQSLEELLALRPEHVSIYLLEVDEGSRLGREVISLGTRYSAPAVPSDDDMAAFYEQACERLAAGGYEHYEISNWALPGRRARHNLKYWQREPYMGFGAGAHSFNGTERWANVHDPAAYVAAIEQGRLPIEQRERLTAQQALDEELFLGLRLLEGIDAARIERQYDVSLLPRLAALRDAGLLEMDGHTARLARSRLAISNEVFVELMG
jgi:oxygen-independent coproporphyrinogen-3 oxidase